MFYTPNIDNDRAYLGADEARHAAQVLRHRVGDAVVFTDGRGNRYRGHFETLTKREATLYINATEREVGRRPFRLQLAVAPTKNIARFEWLLEKATEIGIERITPILCERSERKTIRRDRLLRILVPAMKQSQRTYLPMLDELTPLAALIEQPTVGQRFVAHCDAEIVRQPLTQILEPSRDVLILIGPEGDFSFAEIELAMQHGFRSVSLSDHRLRTETAGMVAVHTVDLLSNYRVV